MLVCATLSTIVAIGAPAPTPVTEQNLQSPSPNDWLMFRGNYGSWGYSALEQIDRENVGSLALAWTWSMDPGPNQATPLVHDGILYLPSPRDVIQALDARSGELLWEYRREIPKELNLGKLEFTPKRNVAIYQNKIFTTTTDGYVVAIDSATGKQLWQTLLGDPKTFTHSSGPIVVRGKVISGRSCEFETQGGCFIAAHDAETGQEVWRFNVIARPGEPGGDTWGDIPLEKRMHVGAWFVGSYDPETNLVYWGTSVPSPHPEIVRGSGNAKLLYSNSTIALDPDTGRLAWYYQNFPRDNWDLDHPFERMLVDVPLNPDRKEVWRINPDAKRGELRKVLTGVPGKTGMIWTLDRATGQFLWATPTVFQNVIADIDPRTGEVTLDERAIPKKMTDSFGTVCPGYGGGKNWPSGSYDPTTRAIYVPLSNACMKPQMSPSEVLGMDFGTHFIAPGAKALGTLQAISVETGKTLWRMDEQAGQYSTMSTAGGLLFAGNSDRRFRAYRSDDGKILWETILNGPVSGFPVSYAVDGEQYVAVTAGAGSVLYSHWNAILGKQARGGNGTLYVFRLSGKSSGASTGHAPVVVPIPEKKAPRTEASLMALPCATYTVPQAEAGERFYQERCSSCHGSKMEGLGGHFPSLTASGFHSRWNNNTASRLSYLIQFGMPPGSAEKLSTTDATNAIARLLQKNGVKAGDALPSGEEPLDALRICLPERKGR